MALRACFPLCIAARSRTACQQHQLGSFKRCYSQFQSQDPTPRLRTACSAPFPKRTHNCGALTAADAGSRVILSGWLLPERKGKLVSFLPLKDSHGTTQLIIDHQRPEAEQLHALSDLPPESVVVIEGTVLLRPPNARRPGSTGDIDVRVDTFTLLNAADKQLPFLPSNPHNLPNEELRARYRYLDLRRTELSDNLKKRSKTANIIRTALHEQDFLEVETPILLRSSPEGAREFLVPTRLASGANASEPLFYALPQSPQQPKQLLICSGAVDRYYQLAKCFRDEDGRKDRQPEFTQVDLEMAFVSWGHQTPADDLRASIWRIGGDEVREVIESLIRRIWLEVAAVSLPKRFPVMTYYEAMSRYGSDKPDTRFGLEIKDLAPYLDVSQQNNLASRGEILEYIVVSCADRRFAPASAACTEFSSVERIIVTEDNIGLSIEQSDIFSQTIPEDLASHRMSLKGLSLKPGDAVWLSRRPRLPQGGSTPLGRLRLHLAGLAQEMGNFVPSDTPRFLWVTEFPLFTHADEDKEFLARGRWSSSHHPFTAPMWQDIEAMYAGRLESVRGQHYDLVLNGVEIGGGSVRIHDAEMQEHVFREILKLDEQEKAPFDQLLHALKSGAPPHAGIALGFDRLMAILCNAQSIRDVIAFPKSSVGTDLLFRSPAPSSKEALKPYGLHAASPSTEE
ncbi:hypothetical protein HGRIS_009617 [Hohenbuehelia grisea]|uniref:Aminoacyl-transfer RNA synthetases class-II family profile domain-containing protein n=1 Tax=Hohenbuehelia grisea TaxID=104357 RepID=A0ABR3J247_9AGAR